MVSKEKGRCEMILPRRKGRPSVRCDYCGRMINKIKPKTRKKGEIEYQYIKCSRCNSVFVISATDEELRGRIKHYTEMVAAVDGRSITEAQARELREYLQANVDRSKQVKKENPLELKPWER